MYNVTLRRVHETLLLWKSDMYYRLACVCMFARACVGLSCAYVHIALLIQHATRMGHTVTSFVSPRSPAHISALSHKRCDFRKKVIEPKTCVFIFSTTFV
jgi:hypothetical protein